MSDVDRIHVRHIMLYHYQKGWMAAQSFRDINELFGEGTISQSQVERWFQKFKSGNMRLNDDERIGRPSNFDDQALLIAVEEDESLTTRTLAETFNVNQSTISRRLKKLGKVWKLSGWVPHELSDFHKAERVRVFIELLERNEYGSVLRNLVTGDECWLLFRNVKRKRVCVSPGQIPKGVARTVHCKKVMWCVWWDRRGIIHWEIISNGFCYWWDDESDVRHEWQIPDKDGKRQYNLNSDVYLAQLDRLQSAIQAKRPRKKNQIVFQHDNARPHVERRVIESIANKNWDLLPHPPYSPTEAPTDYHVNRSLKNWQRGKTYADFDELVADVKAWISSRNQRFFANGVDCLPRKWKAVIEAGGEYAKE